MYSTKKFSQTFSDDLSRSFTKSPKSAKPNISKELNQIERRAFEYPQTLSQKLADASSKSPTKAQYCTDSDSWELHKAILKRGEDYAKHILAQTRGNDPNGEVDRINQNIKKALTSLEDARSDEQKGLLRKITELNGDFTKRVSDLERALLKQVEKLKVELMENIKKEESESEKRIRLKANELVEQVAPPNQRESVERALKPNNYFTPQKSKYGSTPEKKYQTQKLMSKLEESREKVREIGSKPMTPIRSRYENEEGIVHARASSSYAKSPCTPKPAKSLTEYKNSILYSSSPSKEIFKQSPMKTPERFSQF